MRFPSTALKPCWILAGPTATGKTATALILAERLNAEIVSMDSMAIYRTMDIGTAKAAAEELAAVPHHLINVVDPHEAYSVAEYVAAACIVANGIIDRGRIPLFVGGTGLYLRSLLRGVFQGPPADENLRREFHNAADGHSPGWLHGELAKVDPLMAGRLHPNDQRRIIRALEVHRLTGQPLSTQQQHPPRPPEERPAKVIWLEPPRDWLHDRINRRVDRMMEVGLLEETRSLLAHNPPPGKTARQALGYRELIAHLEDDVPLADCVEQIRRGTRQFAKRQHTWFRNLEECRGIPLTGTESPAEIAGQLMK